MAKDLQLFIYLFLYLSVLHFIEMVTSLSYRWLVCCWHGHMVTLMMTFLIGVTSLVAIDQGFDTDVSHLFDLGVDVATMWLEFSFDGLSADDFRWLGFTSGWLFSCDVRNEWRFEITSISVFRCWKFITFKCIFYWVHHSCTPYKFTLRKIPIIARSNIIVPVTIKLPTILPKWMTSFSWLIVSLEQLLARIPQELPSLPGRHLQVFNFFHMTIIGLLSGAL